MKLSEMVQETDKAILKCFEMWTEKLSKERC